MPFFDHSNGTPRATEDRAFLRDASDADWQTILRCVSTESFRNGETLIRIGESGDAFFMLAEGSVEISVPTMFGPKTIAVLGAGAVFGEIAFLDGGVRTANVRALTDGTMLRVSSEAFAKIRATAPQLAARIALDLGRLCALRLRAGIAKARPADGV